MNNGIIKFAIDIDGTLMEHTEVYRKLIESLRESGHEVGVMTGRPPEDGKADMNRIIELGVKIDFFYNTAMFSAEEKTLEEWAGEGRLALDRDDICCMWKARMCAEMKIDVLFDDAADKIRGYAKRNGTMILKSPADHNMVIPKWDKHHVEYDQGENGGVRG